MSNDSQQREIYDMRAKILKDKVSSLNKAKEEGREEGIKEEKINIAKNLLDVLDNETIASKTGLTIEEVNNLRNV